MNAQPCNVHQVSDCEPMHIDPAPQCQRVPLHLAPLGGNAVALAFDGGRLSADAGVVLRKDIDEHLGLTQALAAVLSDPRDARRVHFTPQDLLQQRVLHIAAGYEDAHDSHTRRDDPIGTLALDRLPATGPPLAAQPTIARFDNRVSRTELDRLALVWLAPLSTSSTTPPQVVVLAVDATEEPVHGHQAQARYEGS